MLKNIETCDEFIIKKMAKLPIDIAAEVLTCYCTSSTGQCALIGTDDEEFCPFADTHCSDITKDMWEDYLNE